jgi:ATP phosphoribosyltransferase regulatory subunit
LGAAALLQLRKALSRKDTSAVEAILVTNPVSPQSFREISALPRLFGGSDVLDEAARVTSNPRSLAALENLRNVLSILDIHGVSEFLMIDLGETRGLDYHTGVTFEGFVTGFGEPVCSGGRYDGLTARYGFEAPATGFTFNVLNLLQTLERRPELEASSACDFLLFNSCPDRREALQLARQLRSNGYTTARDIIRREFEQSLAYAHRMNIRYMLVIADDSGCYRAVRCRDGAEILLDRTQIEQAGTELINTIEKNQGDR